MLIQFQADRGVAIWTYHGWIRQVMKKTLSRYMKPKSISFFSLGTANRRWIEALCHSYSFRDGEEM